MAAMLVDMVQQGVLVPEEADFAQAEKELAEISSTGNN
jgi:hypothetical protein